MIHITEPIILDAVDRSVIETVEAFVRFRPGFHGDTGIRDYLYHRLMTNLPDSGTHRRTDGRGTLLAQAEWYTELTYRNKGNASSPGRFDIGIPKPEEIELPKPHALVTFECGRNKRAAALLRNVDAIAEHDGPQPGDITKLAREICHRQLPYGYALECFDRGQCVEAAYLVDCLRKRMSTAGSDRLHVVVVVCRAGKRPILTFLPISWDERIRSRFREEVTHVENLTCAEKGTVATRGFDEDRRYSNRVSREDFLSSCSTEASALIKAIEERIGARVKLVFGGNTMTVNRWPKGRLLRITKALNSIADLDPVVSRELTAILQLSPQSSTCEIERTPAFCEAVVTAVARAMNA